MGTEVRSQTAKRTVRSLDGSRDRRGRLVVLQKPILGTANGERRNRPSIRSLLLQIPETSLSKATAMPLARLRAHESVTSNTCYTVLDWAA
jgi:hypothetical protein